MLTGQEGDDKLFFDIGSELSKIHSIKFEDNGMLDGDLNISFSFGDANQFIFDFMMRTLDSLPEEKLEKVYCEKIKALLNEKWHLISDFCE